MLKENGFTHTPTLKSSFKKSKLVCGFTMIELLVSIAIIGMLFSAIVALTNNLRKDSRDARRLSDMREISKALALYVTNVGQFPVEVSTVTIDGIDSFSTALEIEGVISETPVDPQHPAYSYTYQSDSAGSTYTVSFCLETDDIDNYSQGCGNTITP